MCFTELNTRCNSIISALASCSVSGTTLDSNELADLLYSAFNRDDKGLISVREALDSGIFRLYSTSEDAIYKKTKALDEYLDNEAKIKALESMKYVIENDQIPTTASEVLSEVEEISKRATNIIKHNDEYDVDFKNKVSKKILDDFRNDKKELLDIDRQQKEAYRKEAEKELENLEELKKLEEPEGVKLIKKSKKYAEEQTLEKDNVPELYEVDKKSDKIDNNDSSDKSEEDDSII